MFMKREMWKKVTIWTQHAAPCFLLIYFKGLCLWFFRIPYLLLFLYIEYTKKSYGYFSNRQKAGIPTLIVSFMTNFP